MPSQSNTTTGYSRTAHIHGREIVLIVGLAIDRAGQFPVTLMVDGKVQYEAHYTDKSEDA